MKKIRPERVRFRAFSLAEALITLLIVCLITLASIPILTKKKRDLDSGAHGKWICTRHSLGHLVSWRKGVSTEDETDPDSWAAGCTFVAPTSGRNYAITAIGAGGDGADAESRLELKAQTPSSGSFTPTEDALYRVVVVGGGGGGGGGAIRDGDWCHSRRCGAGGSGASGSVAVVDIELTKGTTYGMSAGSGGNSVGGHTGGCSRSVVRADSGGESRFYTTSDGGNALDIRAGGGQGGQRISCAGKSVCRDNCGGGGGGDNNKRERVRKYPGIGFEMKDVHKPTILINGIDYTSSFENGNGNSLAKKVVFSRGNAGKTGGCGKTTTQSGGGGFDGVNFAMPFTGKGTGGNGGYPYAGGTNGASGYVAVYKIIRLQGGGGVAAEPKEVMVPSIQGRVDVAVGKAIEKDDPEALDANGNFSSENYRKARTTKVEIYDKLNRLTRQVVGYPGDDGEQFEGEYPTDGESSYWTLDGGGAAASTTCTKVENIPVYNPASVSTKFVCKQVYCMIDDSQGFPSGFNVGVPSHSNEIAQTVPLFLSSSFLPTNSEHKAYLEKMSKSYFELYFSKSVTGDDGVVTNTIDYDKFKDAFSSYFISDDENLENYDNYDELADKGYCFQDTANKLYYTKECEQDEYKETASSADIIGYKTKYECPPAGDAKQYAYGAGGGGGYAHSEPDCMSEGGKGASGAIIIEW